VIPLKICIIIGMMPIGSFLGTSIYFLRVIKRWEGKIFNETINECELTDLGYVGNKLTWANNQPDDLHIKERLDRFLASSNWIASFPNYVNRHLLRYTSDHCPIALEFHETRHNYSTNNNTRILRLENIWVNDKDSINIVKLAWLNNNDPSPIKLKNTLVQIAQWGKTKYGEIPTKIKDLQADLGRLKAQVPTKACITSIKEIEKSLDEVLKLEEVWWAQRAKSHWLQ
jgi:hypothetical protein